MVASVLSFVCTVVSIVCTGFVLITYAMFPELRFIPGKLFMMLCANLLCAQIAFALSSATSDSPFLCQVVGAAIHFFWLSVILSMTSCLWLMVNNFLQPLEADNRAGGDHDEITTLTFNQSGSFGVNIADRTMITITRD